MNDKEICRRLIGNSRALLARHLVENSALNTFTHNALFQHNHQHPLISTLLANALYQMMMRKVDKGTQTLLRIPTKPTFYIR